MVNLIKQIIKFGFVGAICFVLDYLLMIFFKEVLGLHYLIATCLSFMISTIANYLLSLRFVFKSRTEMNKGLEFVIYAVLSAIGLGLTELLMWVTVDKLGIYYMVAKIIVTAIVMVYNFITRKLFLEKKNKNTSVGEEE